jgi:hypothetical protein
MAWLSYLDLYMLCLALAPRFQMKLQARQNSQPEQCPIWLRGPVKPASMNPRSAEKRLQASAVQWVLFGPAGGRFPLARAHLRLAVAAILNGRSVERRVHGNPAVEALNWRD